MLWLLLFIGVPVLELAVFVLVADAIGFLPAVALLLAVSVAGAWLSKREGLSATRRLNRQLAAGQPPGPDLVDAGLIFVAGLLMLVPGFVTALVGLALLVPPLRALARRGAQSWLARRVARTVDDLSAGGASFRFIRVDGRSAAGWTSPGEVWDVDSVEVTPRPGPPDPVALPPGGRRPEAG